MANPKKMYVNLDMLKREIQNAVFHQLSSAPSSPVEGQFYYNTVDKKQYVYNGTGWIISGQVDSISAGSAKVTIDNTDPTVPEIDVAVAELIDDTQSTGSNIYSAEKVDSQITAALVAALKFKGTIDCSTNPNYPAATVGDVYVVSVAGKIGGASGVNVEAGDTVYCITDNAGGTQASVGADFSIVNTNIDIPALAAVLAGNGLVVNGSALDVNVDGSTLEISADVVQVKDAGITPAKLANKYAADFANTDFSSGVLTIAAATHALGATKDLVVLVKDSSGDDVTAGVVVNVSALGAVTISVAVGLEFSGRVVIVA